MAETQTKASPRRAQATTSARKAREAAALRANLKRRKAPASKNTAPADTSKRPDQASRLIGAHLKA